MKRWKKPFRDRWMTHVPTTGVRCWRVGGGSRDADETPGGWINKMWGPCWWHPTSEIVRRCRRRVNFGAALTSRRLAWWMAAPVHSPAAVHTRARRRIVESIKTEMAWWTLSCRFFSSFTHLFSMVMGAVQDTAHGVPPNRAQPSKNLDMKELNKLMRNWLFDELSSVSSFNELYRRLPSFGLRLSHSRFCHYFYSLRYSMLSVFHNRPNSF